jgi:chromosome partitioning protein
MYFIPEPMMRYRTSAFTHYRTIFGRGKSMTHIFAIAMQKGGVGKTTTSVAVAVNLAATGAKVLLIDIDPQANATQALGLNPEEVQYSIYEVLLNPTLGTAFATVTTSSGVDVIPSTINLAGAENELNGKVGRETLLTRALRKTIKDYDYILIDSPPNLGLFTLNSLTAATAVIVPLQVHVYAFKAMPMLEATIELVRSLNPQLAIGGIVCTMSDRRTSLSQVIEKQIRAQYEDLVFKTVIPLNIKLAEAPASGTPINDYDPTGAGAMAYKHLTKEIEARYGKE